MKVAVLGTGDVALSLAKGFISEKHSVKIGSRTSGDKLGECIKKLVAGGFSADGGTFFDVAKWADMIVVATLGTEIVSTVKSAGAANLSGKLVLDATNPLDFSAGFPPKLALVEGQSGGWACQSAAPEAKVVKCFNTVGHSYFYKPTFKEGTPDMFICGNDQEAKLMTKDLLKAFGWGTKDIGTIGLSSALEAMCVAWLGYGATSNTWTHAFKLLTK
jgi:predicted dinucleotide-binding enzyme